MNTAHRLTCTVRVAAAVLVDRRVPYWTAGRIRRRQDARVRSIVRHAYDTAPYYRTVMDKMHLKPDDFATAADLARLPIMDDRTFWKDPSLFISSTLEDSTVLRMFTTGTYSGTPKPILVDHDAALARFVIAARDRAVLSALVGSGRRQVQLFLIPDVSNTFRLQDYWDRDLMGRRTLAHRNIFAIDAPLEAVVDRINVLRPDVVFSYGSYADDFFRYVADRRPTVALPKVWMYGGDMMSRQGREIAERECGCIIYSTYNSVETGKLGFECERRMGFHLNVDYCAVRIVDESGREVGPGVPGEVVISNLYNRAMVFLNYRMGDIGVMAERPCPCGRNLPLLADLQGKKMEFLRFPDGSRHMDAVIEVAFEAQLKNAVQYQVSQSGPSGALWRIVPASTADRAALERAVLERSHAIFGQGVNVRVEFVESIPRAAGGKRLRIGKL